VGALRLEESNVVLCITAQRSFAHYKVCPMTVCP
jgi:hypothetical protein